MNETSTPDPGGTAETTNALAERALREGRDELLAEVYARSLPALTAWMRVHRASGLAAALEPDEFVQELWSRLLEHRASFDPARGPFRAWMFGVAKMLWLETANPARKEHRRLPQGNETALLRAPDSITTASRALVRDESIQRLLEYVGELDELDRGILVHHGLEGLSCAVTGQRLGVGEELVSKRWQRLFARMREAGVGGRILDPS